LVTFWPSVRLNQKSGTPSASGFFAAALNWATGTPVALDRMSYTWNEVLPSGMVMPLLTRDLGSSSSFTASSPDICLRRLNVPDWMFCPRGFSSAAATNAFVLFTTSASTSTLPIAVSEEFSSIFTCTVPVPGPS
jgi:hypothetical protein